LKLWEWQKEREKKERKRERWPRKDNSKRMSSKREKRGKESALS
jgi:hypothetical protein